MKNTMRKISNYLMVAITIAVVILGFWWPLGFYYLGGVLAWIAMATLVIIAVLKYQDSKEEKEDNYTGSTIFDVAYEEKKSELDSLDAKKEEIANYKAIAKDAFALGDYETAEKWLVKAEQLAAEVESKEKEAEAELKAKAEAEAKAKEEAEAKAKAEAAAKAKKEAEILARLNKL